MKRTVRNLQGRFSDDESEPKEKRPRGRPKKETGGSDGGSEVKRPNGKLILGDDVSDVPVPVLKGSTFFVH